MFQILQDFLTAILNWFKGIFLSLFEFIKTIIIFVLEIFNWLKTEIFNLLIELVYEFVDLLKGYFPDLPLPDKTAFMDALDKVNVFLPVDDLLTVITLLLTFSLTVRGIRLIGYIITHFKFPKLPTSFGGGGA